MADLTEEEIEKAELAGMEQGYAEDAPPAPAAKVVETPPPADPVDVEPPKAAAAPPPVEYARVKKQEWDNLRAAAGKVANLESQIAKLAGNAPNAEKIAEQVIAAVQSRTAAGLNVELSDEDFAELAADFPELAKTTRTIMERAFKKAQIKGTGEPQAVEDFDARLEKAMTAREMRTLETTYPDWSDIVGRPPADGDPISESNPFRQWLAKQSAAYQKAVNETQSPADVQLAISHFKTSQDRPATAQPARAASRRAIIESNVQPDGDGSAPPPARRQSEEEAFAEGYRTG